MIPFRSLLWYHLEIPTEETCSSKKDDCVFGELQMGDKFFHVSFNTRDKNFSLSFENKEA